MGDTLQVFQNEETFQKERDGLAFTKCLGTVTEHVFPKKAYKIQKKYVQKILEIGVQKEGFGLSSAALKGCLDVCLCLEEVEMHKSLAKKIGCAKKDNDEAKGDGKEKCHNQSELHHERCHGYGKRHARKLTGSMFSPLTISQRSRGLSKSVLLKRPKGTPRSMT
eukprot:11686900-Ditylum_brightwellii.AAC.1